MNTESKQILSERNWTLLLDAIDEGKVVPVIGDNIFFSSVDGRKETVKNCLIEVLSQKFRGDKNCDLPEIESLIEDYNYRNRRSGESTNIYFEINQQLRKMDISCSECISRFLNIGKFPLVLTTSFIPDSNRVLGIKDNVEVYKKTAGSDIDPYSLSGDNPLLYCLFGRASNLSRTYMLTEEDLLDYLHYWHNEETRPTRLSRYLSDKYILILGSDFPDWLFRFFWHSIKNFTVLPARVDEVQGIVSLDGHQDDRDLRRFLSRVQAQVCEDVDSFIEELLTRWESFHVLPASGSEADDIAYEQVQKDVDVFISYASEDYETASLIADLFKAKGASVWFDKKDLQGGDNYEGLIKTNIQRTKRFVPIISRNTLRNERRFFRKEWSIAIDENDYRLKMDYILPVRIDDCDLTSDLIPELFRERHFMNYNSPSFEDDVKSIVRTIRR